MTSVAVTGMHRGENPQPGPSVIASLRRGFDGLRIVGLSYDTMESGLYGHGPDRPDAAYLLPYPAAGPRALLQRLDEILPRKKIDYIIPCLDAEIPNFLALEDEMDARGIGLCLPTRKALSLRKKTRISELCEKHDIPHPHTIVANDQADLYNAAEELLYPVYVKGRFYDARLVYSYAGLQEAAGSITRDWGWPLLVQEALVGEEYDIAGIGDGNGGIVHSCTIRKLLRSSNGKAYGGVVVHDPVLDDLAARFIAALEWNGPFELEFIKVPGHPHALFEMNPRFPAWIDFPSQLGCNMPARLLAGMMGQKAPDLATCEAGKMFIRHSVDIVGDIADLAEMSYLGERAMHNTDQLGAGQSAQSEPEMPV